MVFTFLALFLTSSYTLIGLPHVPQQLHHSFIDPAKAYKSRRRFVWVGTHHSQRSEELVCLCWGGEWNVNRSCVFKTWNLLLTCIKRGGARIRWLSGCQIYNYWYLWHIGWNLFTHTWSQCSRKLLIHVKVYRLMKYDYMRHVNARSIKAHFLRITFVHLDTCTLDSRKISSAIRALIKSILLSSHPTLKDWFA